MVPLTVLALFITAAEPSWQDDYAKATELAIKEKKDLLIHFRGQQNLDEQLNNADVQKKLESYVCLRINVDYVFGGKKLLDYPALSDMMGRPGLLIVSYHDNKLPSFAAVISAHPLADSRYRWVPAFGVEQLKITLDLPATATLTQRSMIYAVRVHPEVPQSVFCTCHPAFLEHAQNHSRLQARQQRQHHADLIASSNWLQGKVGAGFGGASEVVAESWGQFVGGENVMEAAFACVNAWRQSPGHWGAVSRRHSYFGYDIAPADDGTWYATGIFAD